MLIIPANTLAEEAGNDNGIFGYGDDAGANDYEIYSDQALGANETFEHTDRIVLQTTDVLSAKLASAGDVDIVISYLDQTL